MTEFLLFSGSSHPELSNEISKCLGIELSSVELGRFPDGEISVHILDNVRGRDVFVVQSLAVRPNDYLMELLIMIDALKRASAKSIVAVIPYFGYSRQDRKDIPRVPITAKLVANLLEKAGATRVLTMDLHAEQVQGFFDIPVDHLYARPSLISFVSSLNFKKPVIVAPDLGSVNMARFFAQDMHAELSFVNKRRISSTKVHFDALIGDVKDQEVILVDDMCSTAGTLVMAAKVCRQLGAKRIVAACTHGLFVGDALQKLENSEIEELFVSNTIPGPNLDCKRLKVTRVSIAKVFAKAIECVVSDESISSLFL